MAESNDAAAPAAKLVKPNVELFNEQVAKAEKEYNDAMSRYVSRGTCLTSFAAPLRCILNTHKASLQSCLIHKLT